MSLPTDQVVVEEAGIRFVVHVSSLQHRKAAAKTEQRERSVNPFLPADPELTVRPLPPRHVLVLNKFNVLPHHLLIITEDFEPQEALLTVGDITALASCMAEIDGLGFYNGGTVAGASQEHKHLQLVPLPLGPGPTPTPVDAAIDLNPAPGRITSVSGYTFPHALIPLDGGPIDGGRAAELHRAYRRACDAVGIHDRTQPYNWLVTRHWMMVVPRNREHWNGVSVNALGFAGSLLVRNRPQVDDILAIGPISILASVTGMVTT